MLLTSVVYKKDKKDVAAFPFNLPLIQKLDRIDFISPVTFFVGENGSGKSTVLEGIAAASGLPSVGSSAVEYDDTLLSARYFANCLALSWKLKNHKGFFLRAEDFFGFVKRMSELCGELSSQKKDFSQKYTGYGRQLAVGLVESQLRALESRYGDLNTVSHGEGFLKMFMSRLVPDGLYLLDEPEAALSPKRQLSLISLIKEMVEKGCQFIIATHSPIIMAFPGAQILSFDSVPPAVVSYSDLEHVTLTGNFLANPEAFLRRL